MSYIGSGFLVKMSRDRIFFHVTAAVHNKMKHSKGFVLSCGKFAHCCGVPVHMWQKEPRDAAGYIKSFVNNLKL